jgi:iron complex transport system substrate-binding protein
MRGFPIVLCFLSLTIGCSRNRSSPVEKHNETGHSVKYAKGFELLRKNGFLNLRVNNPWQQADGVTYEYWLGTASDSAGKNIPPDKFIQIPVNKVVCLSTTFIGFIDFLHREQTIKGISGKKYVTCPALLDKIANGEIPDVGYDENINYEKLVQIQPDVVFLYGITGSVATTLAKLNEMGIKAVVVAEYLEETPLAKMEWIKYMAAFYDLSEEAQRMFDSVANRYNRLARLASDQPDKPTVLLGLPWGGTWYISGGQSYIARLIHDAGGLYLWRDLQYTDSQPVALEKVYTQAYNADFWLNSGDAWTKKDILQIDERFSRLKAFREDAVFNNNNQVNSMGGNAYFEKGVVEPDIILADIISVLHPHLLPSYQKKYYRKLE